MVQVRAVIRRSPERRYVALGLALAALGILVRAIAREDSSRIDVVFAVLVMVLAVASARSRTELTDDAIVDVRAFTTRTFPKTGIAGVSVSRAPGLRDGYVLLLEMTDGTTEAVRSSRVYSVVASSRHLENLERFRHDVQAWLAD